MGRTLYINQTAKPEIKRDGPSIWVKEEGKAGRRVPARLVGRVIIIGNVRLDSGTLSLFADHKAPITIMNGRAEETAVVIPYNHRLPDHYKEQKVLLHSEGTINHYQQWADSKRALIHLRMLKQYVPKLERDLTMKGFGEGNYQEILKKVRRVHERKWMSVNGFITGIFRNMIIEALIDAGLDPHLGVIHRRHNFGLALDICYIMGGESDMQTIRFFRSANIPELLINNKGEWEITDAGIRSVAHRFENKRVETKEKLDSILDELFDLIREMLS